MESKTDKPDNTESKPDAKDDLKSIPIPKLEKKLASSDQGLTETEAKKRLTQYSPNELTERKTNFS